MMLQIPVDLVSDELCGWDLGVQTGEEPWGLVNEDGTQGFRVIGFKALNHKLDRGVVLKRHG